MEGLLKLFLKRNFFNSEKDFFEIFLKEIFFCLLKIKKCIEPVGVWGLDSYRTIDDAISEALGIPLAPN